MYRDALRAIALFGVLLLSWSFITCASTSTQSGNESTAVSVTSLDSSKNSDRPSVDQSKSEPQSPMKTCEKMNSGTDRYLCEAIVIDLELDEPLLYSDFTYQVRAVDLNRDNREDFVVWMDQFGGTSGYPIMVYTVVGGKLKNLHDEIGWAPIILGDAERSGWSSISFLRQGGGVDPHFVKLVFDGTKYREARGFDKQPPGRVIIDGDSESTYFGPIRRPK